MHATTESVSNDAESVEDEDDANFLRHASFEGRLRDRALNLVSEADKYMHKHHLKSATGWEELYDKQADGAVQCAISSDRSVVSVDTVASFDRSYEENTFVMVGKIPDIVNLGGGTSSPHLAGKTDSAPSRSRLVRKVQCTPVSRSVRIPNHSPVLHNTQSMGSQEPQQQYLLQLHPQPQQLARSISRRLVPHSYTPLTNQSNSYMFGQKQCLQLASYAFSTLSCIWDDYCYQKYKSYFGRGSSNQSNHHSGGSAETELELADMQTKNRVEAQHNRIHLGINDRPVETNTVFGVDG